MNNDLTMPPEVKAYLSGTNHPESMQFDFLIGIWEFEGSSLLPDGNKLNYSGIWKAHYINEKRMIVDDFKMLSPDGAELSSYVTLRTYSPISKRWELSGLAAMLPAVETHEWYEGMEGNEMKLHATGKTQDGRMIKNRITFYEIQEHAFKWRSEISFDLGEHWMEMSALSTKRVSA